MTPWKYKNVAYTFKNGIRLSLKVLGEIGMGAPCQCKLEITNANNDLVSFVNKNTFCGPICIEKKAQKAALTVWWREEVKELFNGATIPMHKFLLLDFEKNMFGISNLIIPVGMVSSINNLSITVKTFSKGINNKEFVIPENEFNWNSF